ncbi:3-deoxy-D-manno-octulosonic acid kinase [Thioalkalivibrio nitratireducens DSM 14787]|uniref:3-deoxy-D-manno-octulosonic acid kinase n=1 Tax=Thioalkalivibrio nitratireducens (strain DSM 14787 / UNIQEM 213 / ALEN2) TaxID=1255043 RepID=L0E111_THIND|nr:3-deoxy-D-manno-octulosonic acid kinase [Thioalkalivibrio nitratireducens]AGA34336.1 3-deoxy-D-manno-octulosonic acid kinase [Thioalkalivibrio nitratireducens DSM 14787]
MQQTDEGYLIHDAALDVVPARWMFDPAALVEQGWVAARGAAGRGQVLFFDPPIPGNDGQWVLRHYLRGGSVARVLGDRYLWTGLRRSRPWREFLLTAEMRDLGLPVPRPVAARIVRAGPYYRADLVTQRIPDARPLDSRLRTEAVSALTWHRVGVCIRQFHDAGYCHADLNSRNILLDVCGRVWLLDWDRGRQRAAGAWREGNLARLRRDLEKRLHLLDRWHFSERDFAALLSGYRNPNAAPPADPTGG